MTPTAPYHSRLSRVRPGVFALVLASAVLAGCAHVTTPQQSTASAPGAEATPTTQQPEPEPNLTMAPAQDITQSEPSEPSESSEQTTQSGRTGMASYYGRRFAGQTTASGETFDPDELTAAHPSLPFGTRIRVTNLTNGQDTVVRVNDRGPFVDSRIIDLSRHAAEVLGMIETGVAPVRLQVLN